MAVDPNKWTIKTQEAVAAALERAGAESHPEVPPDHVLLALLSQQEGVVLPLLTKVERQPAQLRADTEVKLFTTRGGSWPERRTIPEGSPGWSWGDTVGRVLDRHGAPDAEALMSASRTAPGAQWVASILGSSS